MPPPWLKAVTGTQCCFRVAQGTRRGLGGVPRTAGFPRHRICVTGSPPLPPALNKSFSSISLKSPSVKPCPRWRRAGAAPHPLFNPQKISKFPPENQQILPKKSANSPQKVSKFPPRLHWIPSLRSRACPTQKNVPNVVTSLLSLPWSPPSLPALHSHPIPARVRTSFPLF